MRTLSAIMRTGMKLTIELVPKTCFYKNLRLNLKKSDWNKLKKEIYIKAEYVCEICQGVGKRHPVECHEIWDYNESTGIQTLKGLIALCSACHEVKHFGYATVRNRGDIVLRHFMKINKLNRQVAIDYVNEQFEIWQRRSCMKWKQDLSWLDNKGITL